IVNDLFLLRDKLMFGLATANPVACYRPEIWSEMISLNSAKITRYFFLFQWSLTLKIKLHNCHRLYRNIESIWKSNRTGYFCEQVFPRTCSLTRYPVSIPQRFR